LSTILGGFAIFAYMLHWESQTRLHRDHAYRADQEAQQRLQAAATDASEIARDLPRYRQLHQRGFIGEENRHAWIGHLNDIAASHRWLPIEYEFGQPQIASDPSSGVQLRSSAMRLHLLMMHEDAFLQLFAALPSTELAPVIPRKCTITPAPDHHRLSGIVADCEFQWITFAVPKAAI
jgi:hypothetical protein